VKVELESHEHASNGIILMLRPETDVERALLIAAWKHGELKVVHDGYGISIFQEAKPC